MPPNKGARIKKRQAQVVTPCAAWSTSMSHRQAGRWEPNVVFRNTAPMGCSNRGRGGGSEVHSRARETLVVRLLVSPCLLLLAFVCRGCRGTSAFLEKVPEGSLHPQDGNLGVECGLNTAGAVFWREAEG